MALPIFNLLKVYQDNWLKYIKHGTTNIRSDWLRQKCQYKRLSITNILSRIAKTCASNLETRSLGKELRQTIAKGLIDRSYKIVNNINLKLNVEPTPKDTLSNNDVELVSSPKKSIFTDTPSDIHLSTEHKPTALEELDTSNSIDNNISLCDFKGQIMRLNSEIEALKFFFLERIFFVKKSLEEKHLPVGNWDHIESLKEEIKYLRAENQMTTGVIKTMAEKEKLKAQCSHSVVAPITESSKGNPKPNSPRKSGCSEFLSNVI